MTADEALLVAWVGLPDGAEATLARVSRLLDCLEGGESLNPRLRLRAHCLASAVYHYCEGLRPRYDSPEYEIRRRLDDLPELFLHDDDSRDCSYAESIDSVLTVLKAVP